MSAYIVSRGHIAYLVESGLSRSIVTFPLSWVWDLDVRPYKREVLDHTNADRVGQMLWDENIASVSHRYPNENRETLPGPIGETFEYLHPLFGLPSEIDPVQVLKACDCYAYQTCERPDWEKSEAFAYIEALRAAAKHSLPGYDEAAWGAPEAWEAVSVAAEGAG